MPTVAFASRAEMKRQNSQSVGLDQVPEACAFDYAHWLEQTPAEVSAFVVERLQESRPHGVQAVVELLGKPAALRLLADTESIQAAGGMVVAETGKARTNGGVFLKLIRDATFLPTEAQAATLQRIKAEDKELKKTQASKRRTKQPGSPTSPQTPQKAQLSEFIASPPGSWAHRVASPVAAA